MDKILELATRIIENNPHKEGTDDYANWINDLDDYCKLSDSRQDELIYRLEIEQNNKQTYNLK